MNKPNYQKHLLNVPMFVQRRKYIPTIFFPQKDPCRSRYLFFKRYFYIKNEIPKISFTLHHKHRLLMKCILEP